MNFKKNIHGLIPQIFSQYVCVQHACGHLLEKAFFPFRYTILLRNVGNGMLDIDPNV